MGNLVTFSEKLKAVPATEKWKGVLDFVSVEHVAQSLMADVMSARSSEKVRYRHDCSDEVVSLDDDSISKLISSKIHGQPVAVMPMADWIKKAREYGMNDLVCEFLEQGETETGVTLL
ncbi:hypothetical protein CSPAE12_00490 [Colletotrichum incanum]|nr:hypothetical protein CSPAE12_00490 [Colletotrichum incanum]